MSIGTNQRCPPVAMGKLKAIAAQLPSFQKVYAHAKTANGTPTRSSRRRRNAPVGRATGKRRYAEVITNSGTHARHAESTKTAHAPLDADAIAKSPASLK